MEKRINVAELLKDCPAGMELDCVVYDNVTLGKILEGDDYPIVINIGENGEYFEVTEYGTWTLNKNAKCVIFPKGKTTWEGFVPPCKFNDGDIVFTRTNALKCNLENCWVSIFKEYRNNRCACYVCVCLPDLELYHDKWEDELLCELCEIEENRLATEEEREALFKAIKENGYTWNAETKTLDKVIEPKFKVGDKVRPKNQNEVCLISEVWDNLYLLDEKDIPLPFSAQDDWELAPGKFDLSTLVPFESKVLVRDHEEATWRPAIWGFYDEIEDITFPYIIVGGVGYARCIPYESNEHLLNTTDKCEDFYITWED